MRTNAGVLRSACYARNVAETITEAKQFGFQAGDIVQEWLWDEDVDSHVRESIESLTGEQLADEDYSSCADGAIIWWRDGDDEDELADTIVDANLTLNEGGAFWIFAAKPGRQGAPSPVTVANAAKTAGMNAASPVSIAQDWNGILLRAFGRGR